MRYKEVMSREEIGLRVPRRRRRIDVKMKRRQLRWVPNDDVWARAIASPRTLTRKLH